MKPDVRVNQIVFTNKARCRDCYRCVRACPVKAVKMEDGQAYVNDELCIHCGTCVRECPQNAKQYRNDVEKVKALLQAEIKPAVSIAPSYAAVFNSWENKRIPSALRKLGFRYVEETAVGAYYTAVKSLEYINQNGKSVYISTACPSVVSFVEKYHKESLKNLIPVNSPMAAHAKAIKAEYGYDTPVVFIGPCIAKKAEAERADVKDLVDVVITFDEFKELLEDENIIPGRCEESDFDKLPVSAARLFALEGGQLKTSKLGNELISANVVSITGYDDLKDTLDSVDEINTSIVVEPLFCRQGCVNGPGISSDKSIFERRTDLIEYSSERGVVEECKIPELDFSTGFSAIDAGMITVSDEEIKSVLVKTGKTTPEDELNCGACGYESCREKAKAVVRGMAELEMCIPYVRRMAEQRTDKIIESSPNGILILDDELNIIHMNPAFKRFFMCTETVYGKNISYLMDPEPFVELVNSKDKIIETTVRHEKYNLVCHEKLYMLEKDNQYVGIFVDITRNISDREELTTLRHDTIDQAKELLEHQIGMAQELAKYLGESTARGEKLVENLIKISRSDTDVKSTNKNQWLWDIYNSK